MTDPTPDPTPTRDEAVPFPAYGELPFSELGAAVKAAQFGAPEPYEFDPEFYPGHQIVGTINFNSLNRIVTWFVKRALASAPAPASGGVDAVAVKAPYHGARFIISAEGVWLDGVSYPTAEAALAVFDRIRSALSPAAMPVSEAGPVANDCPNCGGSGIVNIDRDDDDNCPECSGTGDEPSTCYNTGLHCLAGCDGKTCIGANLPLNRWPAQALAKPASSPAGGDVVEALKPFADIADSFDQVDPTRSWVICSVLLSDLRRARSIVRDAALSQSTSGGRGE